VYSNAWPLALGSSLSIASLNAVQARAFLTVDSADLIP
jgi:hypothetical protein